MNEFRVTLKRLRKECGISQSKLSQRAGCDHSYVSRLEAGSRKPTINQIIDLACALDLTPIRRDILLMSAGFMPRDRVNVLTGELGLARLYAILTNDDIPAADKRWTRDMLHAVANLVEGKHDDRGDGCGGLQPVDDQPDQEAVQVSEQKGPH